MQAHYGHHTNPEVALTATGQRKGRLTTLVVVVLLAIGFVAVSWYDTYNCEKRVPLGSWNGTSLATSSGGYSTGGPLLFPGTARLCVAGAGSRPFAIQGATDVNGPGFRASFVPTPPSFEGPGFAEVSGIKQRDSLTITGSLATFHPGGGFTSFSTPDVTRATGRPARRPGPCPDVAAPASRTG